MAHHKSAKKRIRRNERKHQTNKSRVSRIRTFMRIVEEAILSGDKKIADTALKSAQPEMHRGVSKGLLKKATVSRQISRFSARIKAIVSS